MTRLRLLLTVVGAAALAASLALAAFSPPASAEKTSTPAETTDSTSSDKNAPVTSESHSWNGYHWARTANPFTLKLGDNVTTAWDSILATSSSDWSKSSVLDTNVVGGNSNKKCKPTSGQVEVCNSNYGRKGWLGIASVWVDSDSHITQGTVKLNDTYFKKTSKYNKPEWRKLLSCQEVGHTLGLDHQDDNFDNTNLGTCMDYASNPLGPPDDEHPNQHDYDELNTIYSHLDTSTTIKADVASKHPAAMNRVDTSNPGERGKLLHKKDRYEIYERDFGKGNKVRTWVIRADEDTSAEDTSPEDTSPEDTSPGSAKQKGQ
jgi:hypothetical protein